MSSKHLLKKRQKLLTDLKLKKAQENMMNRALKLVYKKALIKIHQKRLKFNN